MTAIDTRPVVADYTSVCRPCASLLRVRWNGEGSPVCETCGGPLRMIRADRGYQESGLVVTLEDLRIAAPAVAEHAAAIATGEPWQTFTDDYGPGCADKQGAAITESAAEAIRLAELLDAAERKNALSIARSCAARHGGN